MQHETVDHGVAARMAFSIFQMSFTGGNLWNLMNTDAVTQKRYNELINLQSRSQKGDSINNITHVQEI